MWLGRVYHFNELFEEAERFFVRSLELFDDEDHIAEHAFSLIRLATLAHDRLAEDMTRTYLNRADTLLRDIKGGSRLIAEVRRELANQYIWKWNEELFQDWKWNFAKAEQLHLDNLRELESAGDKEQIAWTLQNLGDTYFEGGKLEEAKAKYLSALDYFEELGILTGKGYALDHLGQIKMREKEIDAARRFFLDSQLAFRESGLKSGLAWSLYNLGEAERLAGKIQSAREYYGKSLSIWEEIKHERSTRFVQRAIDQLNQT